MTGNVNIHPLRARHCCNVLRIQQKIKVTKSMASISVQRNQMNEKSKLFEGEIGR